MVQLRTPEARWLDAVPRAPNGVTRPAAAARPLARPAPQQASLREPTTLSCVVPCFNEAESLAELLPRLAQVLAGCCPRWEVILVDDGSADGTGALLAAWAQRPGFRVLELSRNFGKEAALSAGLQAADGALVVLMDADLQHAPELIPTFVEHWRQGADVAYALREDRADESAVKRLGTRWFYRWVNAGGRFELPAGAGDFRLMDRQVVDALLALPERNRFMKGLYAWVGFKTVAVPYTPAARRHGHSHFNLLRLVRLSMDGLTAFTTLPLRVVSAIGFLLALMSFCYGGYLTLAYFISGHDVNGWTTIVVSLMLFSGIQLMSLGVVGAYIGRIFEEVKGRPLFVVRRALGHGLKDAPG